MELDLVHQLRDEAGMPALLGKGGAEAFAALDAIEARFGNKVLQDASVAAEGKTALAGPTRDVLLQSGLASIRHAAPAAPMPPAAIDISLFADTGFTTSSLDVPVRGGGQAGRGDRWRVAPAPGAFHGRFGRVPPGRRSPFDAQRQGRRNGHVSVDVGLSATDRISKSDGTFVALYTSTANGHFDVRCCARMPAVSAPGRTASTRSTSSTTWAVPRTCSPVPAARRRDRSNSTMVTTRCCRASRPRSTSPPTQRGRVRRPVRVRRRPLPARPPRRWTSSCPPVAGPPSRVRRRR